MANWHLNYGISGKNAGDRKLNVNLTTSKNGLHLTMGGGIPEGIDLAETVFPLVEKHLAGLDDLDASDPANHAKTLDAIAAYCTELSGLLKQ